MTLSTEGRLSQQSRLYPQSPTTEYPLKCHCGHEWLYIDTGSGELTTCPACHDRFPIYKAHHYALTAPDRDSWEATVELAVPPEIEKAVRHRADVVGGEPEHYLLDYIDLTFDFQLNDE